MNKGPPRKSHDIWIRFAPVSAYSFFSFHVLDLYVELCMRTKMSLWRPSAKHQTTKDYASPGRLQIKHRKRTFVPRVRHGRLSKTKWSGSSPIMILKERVIRSISCCRALNALIICLKAFSRAASFKNLFQSRYSVAQHKLQCCPTFVIQFSSLGKAAWICDISFATYVAVLVYGYHFNEHFSVGRYRYFCTASVMDFQTAAHTWRDLKIVINLYPVG